jgi:hypothetical protein
MKVGGYELVMVSRVRVYAATKTSKCLMISCADRSHMWIQIQEVVYFFIAYTGLALKSLG